MNTLQFRLVKFAIMVYEYAKKIRNDALLAGIANQLMRSASSAGANYSEAQAASSRKDFHNKVRIALKEMKETHYWLILLQQTEACVEDSKPILRESEELTRILSTICKKMDLPAKPNS